MKIDRRYLRQEVKAALAEDVGKGDVTTMAVIPARLRIEAKIVSRSPGIVCGLKVCREVFRALDRGIKFTCRRQDGDRVGANAVVAVIRGKSRAILTGERTALNYLGRLSGIATLTDEFARKVKPFRAKIYDTRKTTPKLRLLEKYAVRVGGGRNHRFGLYDQVLIKDNHISVRSSEFGVRRKKKEEKGGFKELVREARREAPKGMKIEVEVDTPAQFEEALGSGADVVMLDNMTPAQVRRAVKTRNQVSRRRVRLEVSGGVTLKNVRSFARAGVEMISSGSLTHSAPALDFSLEVTGVRG